MNRVLGRIGPMRALLMLGLVIAAWGGFVFVRDAFFRYYTRPFDRSVWVEHKGDQSDSNPRVLMVGDLLSRHIHVGMTESDVRTLLGEPDSDPNDRSGEEGPTWWYGIGPTDFGSFGNDQLVITFDHAGRLKRANIHKI